MTPRRVEVDDVVAGLEVETAGLARVGMVGAVPGATGAASNRCFIALMLYTLAGRSGALMAAKRGAKQHVSDSARFLTYCINLEATQNPKKRIEPFHGFAAIYLSISYCAGPRQ